MSKLLHTIALALYAVAPALLAYEWWHTHTTSVAVVLLVAVFLDTRAILLPWISKALKSVEPTD